MAKKRATLRILSNYAEARAHFLEHGSCRMYRSRSGKLKRFNGRANS